MVGRGFQPRRVYWCNLNRSANAEVDYVIERGMKVTPLEVKSGTRGSMKSLRY